MDEKGRNSARVSYSKCIYVEGGWYSNGLLILNPDSGKERTIDSSESSGRIDSMRRLTIDQARDLNRRAKKAGAQIKVTSNHRS